MALLLTTDQGLFLITQQREIVPLQRETAFTALASAGPLSPIYYAATTGGEVYRSADSARSWAAAGSIPGFRDLSSLAVDPRNPDRLLAGMEPSALFRSEDG